MYGKGPSYLSVQVVSPPSDKLVKVSVHELEHQRQPTGGLVIQHLFQGNDVLVGTKSSQRLDLA